MVKVLTLVGVLAVVGLLVLGAAGIDDLRGQDSQAINARYQLQADLALTALFAGPAIIGGLFGGLVILATGRRRND